MRFIWMPTIFVLLGSALTIDAGPYSAAADDPTNAFDAPTPGFTESARVNPLFFGWASSVTAYSPAPGVTPGWMISSLVLGPVTGNNSHILSLGDLYDVSNPAPGDPDPSDTNDSYGYIGHDDPGTLTVRLDRPVRNYTGADFSVFENGFASSGGAGVVGQIFAELAYVEVSSNGVDFARFPAQSLTPALVGSFGTIDATNVYNLAGKHANASGSSWGTPFDLDDLLLDPLVMNGTVDLEAITHVRLVDIPGGGFYSDASGNPIYDSWVTWGSGGFDAEAIGVIGAAMTFDQWPQLAELPMAEREPSDNPDDDPYPNLLEYAFAMLPDEAEPNIVPFSHEIVEVSPTERYLSLTFRRDERASDLLYEVQVSDDLQEWTTIASSSTGEVTTPANAFTPVIHEANASPIATVGVVRHVQVRDVLPLGSVPRRFLRLRVTQIP